MVASNESELLNAFVQHLKVSVWGADGAMGFLGSIAPEPEFLIVVLCPHFTRHGFKAWIRKMDHSSSVIHCEFAKLMGKYSAAL